VILSSLIDATAALLPHLVAVPILLPLASAALMLFIGDSDRGRKTKSAIGLASCVLGLLVALVLLLQTTQGPVVLTYSPGNWTYPFGISLVADGLASLMLVLSQTLAIGAVCFAQARWQRAGVHFNAMFQFQLMGVSGAFLTGDIFNLFVFFEILLAASYGLLLHGSGGMRVRAGLHYVAVNLVASMLLLVGIAVVYGVTGSLSMADIAARLPQVPPGDQGLLRAGAAVLGVGLLIKAGVWPLNFWLGPTYASAGAPVAAYFALMTKIGLYALLRLWTLAYPGGSDVHPAFGAEVLAWAGLVTLAIGSLGMLATYRLDRLAAAAIIASAGTVLAALALGQAQLTAAALFYVVASTWAAAALFLLVELVERSRQGRLREATTFDDLSVGRSLFVAEEFGDTPPPEVNLDEFERALVGTPISRALAALGLGLVCCTLMIAGLPPMAGFVAKATLIQATLEALNLHRLAGAAGWTLIGLLVVSSLAALVGLTRAGVHMLWAPVDRPAPRVSVVEWLPIASLCGMGVLLALYAGHVMTITTGIAQSLYAPSGYIQALQRTVPVPSPTQELP